jgi:hypothetical protein
MALTQFSSSSTNHAPAVFTCGAHLQALKHYGDSVRLGHKAILQSLPRLLTLYFEFGSKMAATKNPSVKPRTAQTQVRLSIEWAIHVMLQQRHLRLKGFIGRSVRRGPRKESLACVNTWRTGWLKAARMGAQLRQEVN